MAQADMCCNIQSDMEDTVSYWNSKAHCIS